MELMQVFFSRWKNLSLPAQECQKIFKCAGSIDNNDATKAKLIGYGFQLLENIDPNPDNFVCAGIIHTRSLQIGTLLRLEPNKQAQVGHLIIWSAPIRMLFYTSFLLFQMYRLTVRSSKDAVSQHMCEVLCEQF